MPKVLITDSTFAPLDIERNMFEPLGLTVIESQCRHQDDLKKVVPDADFVLTQFAPVDAEVIATMERARVIVRYGIGVDNVDLDAARKRQIPVCNVPDYCIDEVADHTLALILAATRQVIANADVVRQGNWGLGVPPRGMLCLKAMTVGIVGFGRIGREVAARLRPFKCRLLVFDPAVDTAVIHAAGCEPISLEQLFATSDLITLHCPSNGRTRHLVNASSIATMKTGVILVNVARGTIVCTEALVEALDSGAISFAALDVLETEPLPLEYPLRKMPNSLIHSHIASISQAALNKLRRQAAQIVVSAAQGEPLLNVVNGLP